MPRHRSTAEVRICWGSLYAIVTIQLTSKGFYPKCVVIPLAMVADEEKGIVAMPPGEPDVSFGPKEGWEFHQRKGCGCEMIYDAAEPPWVVQIRTIVQKIQSNEVLLAGETT